MQRTAQVQTERQDSGLALAERAIWCAAINMAFQDATAGRSDAIRFLNESATFNEICGYLGLDANSIRTKAAEHSCASSGKRRYRSALLNVGKKVKSKPKRDV